MKRKLLIGVLLGLFAPTCISQSIRGLARQESKLRLVGYLAEARIKTSRFFSTFERSGSAGNLTHLIYAFAKVANGRPELAREYEAFIEPYLSSESIDSTPDPTTASPILRGVFGQLSKLKRRHPHLKVMISIGGANAKNASELSLASRSEESRRIFVSSCIDMFIRGNLPHGISAAGLFDGIDVDWEYPVECSGCVREDKGNFTQLLLEFRRQLDTQGKRMKAHYLLTIAGSPWADDYEKYEWPLVHPLLDFVNVMTYDLASSAKTRPHSPLYKSSVESGKWTETFNADYAITHYLAAGVPAQKVVMGIPFYGRGWGGVPDTNHGLYQSAGRWARGTWGEGRESYRELTKLQGFQLFRDPETKALWVFNSRDSLFWSYDDPASMAIKTEYVRKYNLGGVAIWELTGDDIGGTLLRSLHKGLHQ